MDQEPNLTDEHEQLRMYSDENSADLLHALEQGAVAREKKPTSLSEHGSMVDLANVSKAGRPDTTHHEAGIELEANPKSNHHAVNNLNKLLDSDINKAIDHPELLEPFDAIEKLSLN